MIVLRGISEAQFGLASAISVIFFLIVLVIGFVQFNLMQKREERMQ